MRTIITFTPDQFETLNTLMREDNATNRTAYINHLIGAEARRRREQSPTGADRLTEAAHS